MATLALLMEKGKRAKKEGKKTGTDKLEEKVVDSKEKKKGFLQRRVEDLVSKRGR
jgi:hypothetical protein